MKLKNLKPEQRKKYVFAEMAKQFKEMKKKIGQMNLEESERKEKAITRPIGMRKEEIKEYSCAKALRGILFDNWDGANMERDVIHAINKTATLANPSNLGFFVPNEVASEIINPMRSDLFLAKLGIKRRTGLKAVPYETNRKTDSGSIQWIGEGSVSLNDHVSVDRLSMYPHTAAIASTISLKLLETGGQAAEAEVRETLQAIWERGIELAFIEGDGNAGDPIGMRARALNTKTIGDTLDVMLDDMKEMIGLLAADNVPLGSAKWLMPEQAWQSLTRGQVALSTATPAAGLTNAIPLDGYGAIQTQVLNGVLTRSLWGYPVVTSTQLSTATDATFIYLADWNQCIFADWGPPSISVERGGRTNQLARQVSIAMFYDCDFSVEHGEAICTGTDFDIF